MRKQTKKPPVKPKKKNQAVKKKDHQPISLKRLIFGEEKPVTELEAGKGVNLSFIFKRQPKEKILCKIAQTTMVNRSRMRDVGDTRQDFEELDRGTKWSGSTGLHQGQ